MVKIEENFLIDKIEIFQSKIKLKKSFITSLGAHDHAENIIVIIFTNTGIIGYGECSPYMTIQGETIETCFLIGQIIAKVLKGKNPLKIAECSRAMDVLIYGNTSIKSAFDIALYDIAAQHAGIPLYKFLGGAKKNKTLITDYTVSMSDPLTMALDAQTILNQGFKIIKVKLGGTLQEDVERLSAIRKKVGSEIPIRIDANQAWHPEQALQILNALSVFNIQFCEEPIPRWEYPKLTGISKESAIPVMADESCFDHHDAEKLISLKACSLFNVKLGKSSGIFKALKIIKLAEAAGIKMQVGGFLESRLGFTAAAHVAMCSDSIEYCDFDTPLMFEMDPINGGITYGNNGIINVTETPGLGATVSEAYLKEMKKALIF